MLLDDVRRPARDAPRRDHRREEVDRDADRVEERRRVEVDVGDQLLLPLDARVELDRDVVPEALAGLGARPLADAVIEVWPDKNAPGFREEAEEVMPR